jgi:hypothetical protein
MNQQPDLDKVMDELKSTEAVRRLKHVMNPESYLIQIAIPIEKLIVDQGIIKPTGEYTQRVIGTIRPSIVPDRVFIGITGTPIVVMVRARDIEAIYMVFDTPPAEQKRIIEP